jgi:hypothetical protein
MQFDAQRAFPYPVLRPDINDYVDGEFQALIDFRHQPNSSDIELDAQFALSVDEIAAAISKGNAKYVVVVSCRDTYFRRVLKTRSDSVKAKFFAGDLRGEVQVFPYIVADKTIPKFSCSLINQEFGPGPFSFKKGSVLAVDTPREIFVDRDLFKPITSIFEFVKKDSISGAEWQIEFSGDKVRIAVSTAMKEKIDNFRTTSKNKAILLNSLYFAAVMQCLSHLKGKEYDNCRWAHIIRQQCTNHHLNIETHDEYMLAQRLMKFPLSVMDTYLFRDLEQ